MKQKKEKPSEFIQRRLGISNWCHNEECKVCQKERKLIDRYLQFKKK